MLRVMTVEDVPSRCLACGSSAAQTFTTVEDGDVRQCERCGLGWLSPMPDDAALARAYGASYGAGGSKFIPGIESLLRLSAEREARRLLDELGRPAPVVVDYGCGRGLMASALARRGARAIAVERSAEAALGLDERVELHVARSFEELPLQPGSVDAVLLRHVLEHLRDPRAALAGARRLLRPDGLLVVEVPNFASLQARLGRHWLHLDPPRHLWQFTEESLLRLLDDVGFAPGAVRTFHPLHGPMGWLQSALNAGGLPRDRLYCSLYRASRRRARDVVVDGAAAVALFPASAAMSVAEAALGRGAVLATTARPRA